MQFSQDTNCLIWNWITQNFMMINDTIVAWGKPLGPVCHKGTVSCFDQVENDTLKENL